MQFGNLYTAWRYLLETTMRAGRECTPRGLKIRELLHTQITIPAMWNVIVDPHRDLNYRFMVAEWLWIQAGRNDVEFPASYNSKLRQFSDDGKTFAGAYGPRLAMQWYVILKTLRQDPDSRQAVATIWRWSDPQTERYDILTDRFIVSKDVPCTIAVQFLIRGGALHSIWTMRSNDLWLGFPYDAFTFTQLQNGLAGELGVKVGYFTLQAGSSHLYEQDWTNVQKVSDCDIGYCVESPALVRVPRAEEIIIGRPVDKLEHAYGEVLKCPTKAHALKILTDLNFDTNNFPIRPTAV